MSSSYDETIHSHGGEKARETRKLQRVGRYVLHEKLGAGAFAVVYRATDEELSRPVAVKLLKEEVSGSEVVRARFLRESRTVSRINHPNVVGVHDAGEDRDQLYIVMELVEGQGLDQLLAGDSPDLSERVRLLENVALGLAQAHREGIVHRDVKPANIIVSQEGVPKIADFGLAHLHKPGTLLTASGDTLGTPAYMAPEQVQGGSDSIGPETDVYALGMILYQILAGKLAFSADSPVRLYKHIVEDDPLPPRQEKSGVPWELEVICLKALSKERARRYPHAGAFSEDLRRWRKGDPIQARPDSIFYRIRRKILKRKQVLFSFGAALLVIAGVLVWVLPQWEKSKEEKAEAEREKQKLVREQNDILATRNRLEEIRREGKTLFTKNKLHLERGGSRKSARDLIEECLLVRRKAVDLAPENPEVLYELADLHFAIGEKEKALSFLNRCWCWIRTTSGGFKLVR